MQFNSFTFIVYIIVVIIIYFLMPQKAKSFFLLAASIFFYAYWEWWAPIFLVAYALVNFFIAKKIENTSNKSKYFLILGIIISIFLFVFFRYTGLFDDVLRFFTDITSIDINIIFPIGFSYYMFKNISYLFDVNSQKIKAEKKIGNYLLYVSYFPEIFMGPISRAADFLPQIDKKKLFDTEIMNQSFIMILIAFAKKILIADRISIMLNPYMTDLSVSNGFYWLIISLVFMVQLYLDFSAYSDISIAISNMLGYNIKANFRAPFLSLSISDFWRRWHISLSSWLSDYIFVPLQFLWRRLAIYSSVAAAIVTLIISGLWHGPTLNWFFYGVFMGIAVGVDAVFSKKRKRIKNKISPLVFVPVSSVVTMLIVLLLSVFIFTPDIDSANLVYSNIFNISTYSIRLGLDAQLIFIIIAAIIATLASHIIELKKQEFLSRFFKIYLPIRYIIYLILIFSVIIFGVNNSDIYGGFIYAQF